MSLLARAAARAQAGFVIASIGFGQLLSAAATAREPDAGSAPESALPYASQSQVNSTTTGVQSDGAVAALGGGGWVVVWKEGGGFISRIRARAYRRDGTPASDELTIATDLALGAPEIAPLDDGRFVVVWRDELQLLDSPNIYGRFLDSSGLPVGSHFPVVEPGSLASEPAVAASPGGGFVVAWRATEAVTVRRFDASGAPLAPAQPATTLVGSSGSPRLARLDGSGGHIVVWVSLGSAGSDNSGLSVQWRRLAVTGAFVGPESQANSYVAGNQQQPDVAATPGGGFALVWRSAPPSGVDPDQAPDGEPIGDGIDLRFFHASGVPVSPEVTISAANGQLAGHPSIRSSRDGDLLVAWRTTGGTGSVQALRTAPWPHGIIVGELRIDDYSAATLRTFPQADFDSEGDFAVVWGSDGSPGDDDSASSVQLRTFTPGRVAHWRFEESSGPLAFDGAGLHRDDATLSGGGDPAWSWGGPGRGALAFSGNGFADVPFSPDFDLACCAVTLTAWLYLETLPSELVEPFASIYDAAQDNYVLYLDRDLAELRFKVTNSLGTAERPGIAEAVLPLRRWFHVAGVYRGEGSASIYLDGVLADIHVNSDLYGPVRSTPEQVAAMGRDGVNDRYYFDGRIDEIEVWTRGLTEAEIMLARGPWLFGDGFERGDTLDWSSTLP